MDYNPYRNHYVYDNEMLTINNTQEKETLTRSVIREAFSRPASEVPTQLTILANFIVQNLANEPAEIKDRFTSLINIARNALSDPNIQKLLPLDVLLVKGVEHPSGGVALHPESEPYGPLPAGQIWIADPYYTGPRVPM
jgi:hypothetical protein